MKNANTLLSTNNNSCWLSWLSFVLVTVLSLFQLNAQKIQPRPSDQRIPAGATASDKSLYSSPDILNVPSGYTVQQIQAKINSQYSLAKNGTSIVPNPDLPSSLLCEDLRVIFVLDESGSINSTEANEVRAGAIALANSLLNSGAELRVIEFNTTSSIVNLGGSLVNASFITNLNNYLYGTSGTRYNPISSGSCTGWTNWEDALEDVQTLSGDLVIFFTDGNPTAYNVAVNNGCASGSVTVGSNGSYSATTALNRAIGEANIIKNQGKHMIVAAVGSDLNLQNCKDISGNDDFAVTGSVFTADYIVGEFNSLALDLAAIANSICGTDLVFTKTASALSVCSGEQVTFTLSVTNTGGDYNFAAYNTVITDVFPNGFSNLQILAPVPAGASLSGNTLTYNVGDLAVNQTKSISIKATVNIPPGNFTNTAFAIANNANQQSSSVTVNSGYASEVLNISSCDPYVLNGITYNNTGTYTQELTSAAGCDSILTLNFTRRQATSGSQQASACGSYVWNGNTYTSSGQYSVTLTNAQGCDSTAVLNLTVTPQPPMPETACYQTATFNSTTCSWDITGTQPEAPTGLACYEEANFNTATCAWEVTGEMPAQPATACYEEANFNTATCSWDVTGEMPAQPATACYEEANFNTATCAWEVTGEMPAQPATACYEEANFNTATCAWEVTGEMPAQPSIACYEEANFNTTTCSWDVTGEMPAQPSIACYEEANFNTTTCSWDVTGEMPAQPATACYEEANFNTATCAWEVTGEMPAQPATACYEEANFNTATCSWDVTGEMPAQPATACYEEANFNTATCSWDVTGEMPAQPATACYEEANFNTATCAWEVTGEMPAQPATACYEEANFNTATCAWDVTGEMPAQPATACYEEANFNTATCAWEVTGEMPAQPATACYEEANFNTATCAWEVTGSPNEPIVTNANVCGDYVWVVNGETYSESGTYTYYNNCQDYTLNLIIEIPTGTREEVIACGSYTWNGTTYTESGTYTFTNTLAESLSAAAGSNNPNKITICHVTGNGSSHSITISMNALQAHLDHGDSIGACENDGDACATVDTLVLTIITPEEAPETACYQTATFNSAACSWDVTGEMPAQPTTACYEEANFNTATCAWEVTGEMPAQPATACYESASFNTATCSWDVTGEMPAQPATACYEEANFNTATCAWEVTGEMPAQPATACYESASFNTATCSWDVTGEMPEMPVLESYQTATFNPVTCVWDVTGTPPSGCYAVEVFAFNQGLTKPGTAVNAERSNPLKALGAPDGQNPAVNAPVQNFVSLGFGGSIELDFGYEIANGPGADIKIWESSASPNMEKAQILVSKDGLGYLPVAVIQQGGEVDFGGVYSDYIRFVKIVDVSNLADFSNVQVSDGYDVDAIECIHGRYIIPQTCVGSTVISTSQGLRKNGTPVLEERSDETKALGAPQVSPVGVVDFYALGFGGEMTIAFDGPVANGPGADIRITETTWNYTCANYPETADVFASQDGMNYVYLGQTCMSNSFDLGALSWAQYIRIVDVSDAALFPADADGYDVNGIECLHPGLQFIPGDDDLTPCAAAEMVSYNPGTTKNGNPVAAIRSNPSNALGAPQSNDTYNFVSLGFGGELVLKYDFVIFNLPGNDIKVIETSFGNPSCPNYPETARISVSMDGVNFSDLGELCLDGTIDLGSVPYAQYVKVTDISNSGNFGGSADGYDVDAVVVLNGPCAMNMARSGEFDNISTPDETIEMNLMPNPATEFTVINLSGTTARTQWIVEVIDAAGRLVNRESFTAAAANSQYFLKLNQLESGIYMVRVSNGEEQFVQRLVK